MEHVARMGETRCMQYFSWKTPREETCWKT